MDDDDEELFSRDSESSERSEETFETDAMWEEIERRVAELDANPSAAIPWEQVEADILARLKK
jgi:putative addiction module component (TIGR02574 family)